MLSLHQLLTLDFCTHFEYLSENAQDFHFSITFAAKLRYKVRETPSLWDALLGEKSRERVVKEEVLNHQYFRKKVRWYSAESKELATVDEEIKLNKIYQDIGATLIKTGKLANSKTPMHSGYHEYFPMRIIEVLMQD
jgi:hypothetical protein